MNFIKKFLLNFLILIIFSCAEKNKEFILELDSNWKFQSENDDLFLPASVPGTVHLDLIKNGKIDDPFFRLNEHELQWIDKLAWNYKTSFNIRIFSP